MIEPFKSKLCMHSSTRRCKITILFVELNIFSLSNAIATKISSQSIFAFLYAFLSHLSLPLFLNWYIPVL